MPSAANREKKISSKIVIATIAKVAGIERSIILHTLTNFHSMLNHR